MAARLIRAAVALLGQSSVEGACARGGSGGVGCIVVAISRIETAMLFFVCFPLCMAAERRDHSIRGRIYVLTLLFFRRSLVVAISNI